jgi:hypothetical protein
MCPASSGLSVPPATLLSSFCAELETTYSNEVAANGGYDAGFADPKGVPVCLLKQLTPQSDAADFLSGTCARATVDKGWCYVTGAAAGKCAQAIAFAGNDSVPPGATANLQCVR